MAKVKNPNSEEVLHQKVVNYLKTNYPGLLFRTDFAAGIKMTMGQAKKHAGLQAGRAWPDLQIATPMYKDQLVDFYGLFIELKKEGTKLVREKDASRILKGETELRVKGDWWDKHIEEQANVLQMLKLNGYCATFAVGYEEAINVIDRYLSGNPFLELTAKMAELQGPADEEEPF